MLFDIDGTLVDTNFLHAVTWAEAFRSRGYQVSTARLHRFIGQGSERLVRSVLGVEDRSVSDAHDDFYGPHLHHLHAFEGAGDLLRKLSSSGATVVLATSAARRDADHLLGAIDASDAISAVVTTDDVESSKPDPDLVVAGVKAAGVDATECIFVGDTVWDVEAAARAGVPCICVLTGGIDERELREAGAVEVYENVEDLSANLDASAIGALLRR